MRMPVPKSLLSTATAPAGPHRRHAHRSHRQGRDHGLVGQPFALVLRAQLVAGGVVQDLADLGRCRLVARLLDLDQDLAGHHQGRGKDPITDPFLRRSRLARQGVLIDHGHALGDDPVDRDDLAGVDHDHIQRLELIQRDLDLGAVAVQPDVARLLAEGVQEQLLGIVLRLLDQNPAEAEAPAEDGPRENRHGPQTSDHDDGVQHVDPQPPLLDQDLARGLEGRDRGIGKQHRRGGQEPRRRELRDRGQRIEAVQSGRCRSSLSFWAGFSACASADSRISMIWSLLNCLRSYWTRTVLVSGLVLK